MRLKSQKKIHILFLLFVVIFTAGRCTPVKFVTESQTAEPRIGEISSPTISPMISATNTLRPRTTIMTVPTSMPTLEPISTITLTKEPFPDILFFVGGSGTDMCPSEDKNQIWFSGYPYETFQSLSPDSSADYNYPEWSPDGEWIAYVGSKSSVISEEDPTLIITGTDTVWIMHPDGSEAHEVSEGITSTIIQYLQGAGNLSCVVTSSIINPLIWSPNGEYIIFTRSSLDDGQPYYSYYLTDVYLGNTHLLLKNQKKHSNPIWISNNQVALVEDHGMVKVLSVTDKNQFDTITFLFPPEVQPDTELVLMRQTDDDILVGSFFFGVTNTSQKPEYQSIWGLNILTGEWNKIFDLNIEGWGSPQLGNQVAAMFRGQEIIILDPLSWQTNNTVNLPADIDTYNKKFIPFRSDIVSFIGSVGDGNEGLWAIRLHLAKPEPELILDLSHFQSLIGSEEQVFDYSFRP